MRKLSLAILTPFLLAGALLAWVFASPIGASPDDDHHLVSAWCANGIDCPPGAQVGTYSVPKVLTELNCFAHEPEESAACQGSLSIADSEWEDSSRGNFNGAYPPGFFWVNGLFAGDNVAASALTMRAVNALIFVLLGTAAFLLLPPARRASMSMAWLITSVPLGIFILASNNPSSWALTGMALSWPALWGYFETTGARRLGLGAVFGLAMVLAASARADAALYVSLGALAVGYLCFTPTREFWLRAIYPAIMTLAALVTFLYTGQSRTAVHGFTGVVDGSTGEVVVTEPVGLTTLLGFNTLHLPDLWAGVFGSWGLGWLDTALPPIVLWAAAASFIAVIFAGLSGFTWRTLLPILGAAGALIVVPMTVLAMGGDPVGANVQPRYILPLIMLFAGLVVTKVSGRVLQFGKIQLCLIGGALTGANAVALHTNIRRYVTGVDAPGLNLNAGAEWWWAGGIPPLTLWALGSLAFGGAVYLLLRDYWQVQSRQLEICAETPA